MIPSSLALGAPVSAQDRSDVIDLVNRLNMAFDIWDLDTMLSLHTDDFTVHHPKGTAQGHDQMVARKESRCEDRGPYSGCGGLTYDLAGM